jgi:acyl-CoA synthetase (AMP-forming)/AMP-acid ligase II
MFGLMQDWPLLWHRIIEHAAAIHGHQVVVTRSVEGSIHRTNYKEIHERALKVSQALDRAGMKLGDRIATIAWNTWRHLECWYGIMGIGAICHTVNPRLFPEQIAWIVNHAQDRIVITDVTFVPLLEQVAAKMPSVERFVVLTDKANMPETKLKNTIAYEEWIVECDGDFKWKTFDENTAAVANKSDWSRERDGGDDAAPSMSPPIFVRWATLTSSHKHAFRRADSECRDVDTVPSSELPSLPPMTCEAGTRRYSGITSDA